MSVYEKLEILADAAKYDVSCSSSGSQRKGVGLGNAVPAGVCHSFSDDGRCISLLKILYTNKCIYDCSYCINRSSNDTKRAEFTPDEVVDLTISFYRRNYIEGLFLSSGVVQSPNYTMEMLIKVVKKLREVMGFNGYIHMKGIPGADTKLIELAGKYVDRMSINIELPTTKSLRLLAPQKNRQEMIAPMGFISEKIAEYKALGNHFKNKPDFIPAGQSTQLIVGATSDADYSIIKISEALYNKMKLKRVYYSAYVPVNNLPMVQDSTNALMKREHRIYQADWLLRFYGFRADEILTKEDPYLDLLVDPKCQWALRNMHVFPMEVNKAPMLALLRIPGIGAVSAKRIVASRRFGPLGFDELVKMGVVMKRAKFFITCKGKMMTQLDMDPFKIKSFLLDAPKKVEKTQMSMFELFPGQFNITGQTNASSQFQIQSGGLHGLSV